MFFQEKEKRNRILESAFSNVQENEDSPVMKPDDEGSANGVSTDTGGSMQAANYTKISLAEEYL